MLSGVRERVEELAARAGLSAVPSPVLMVAAVVVVTAIAWALLKGGGTEGVTEPQSVAPAVESSGAHAGSSRSSREATRAAELVVHVIGAVRHPGVYRLAPGSRAEDAVRAAGGSLGDAAPEALNLARVLADGEQLTVPTKDEAAQAGPSGAAQASPGGAAARGVTAPGSPLDLNTATAEQLDALPGIGPSTAAKIVQDREKNGPFKTVEDLSRVPGIGPKKVDALKDLVRVG